MISRNDVSALWENFLISERYKHNGYSQNYTEMYFWKKLYAAGSRFGGGDRREMEAFEMKRKKPKAKLPSTFVRSYPDTRHTIVNHENYINFLD